MPHEFNTYGALFMNKKKFTHCKFSDIPFKKSITTGITVNSSLLI